MRFDCVAGRAKIVGHASGELFSRKCRFNIDIAKLKAGWLDFQANAESAIVGTDRDNPPPGAGAKDGPKWGVEVRVAMPYATTFDDVEIKKVPPCLIRTTTALLLEALASLWDAYDEDTKHKEGDIACVEVAGWESVHQGRRQEVLPAALQDPGLRRRISRSSSRALNDDDDDATDAQARPRGRRSLRAFSIGWQRQDSEDLP